MHRVRASRARHLLLPASIAAIGLIASSGLGPESALAQLRSLTVTDFHARYVVRRDGVLDVEGSGGF